jgi:hypothetical protein
MGEVDHPHHAEDDGEPQPDQGEVRDPVGNLQDKRDKEVQGRSILQ